MENIYREDRMTLDEMKAWYAQLILTPKEHTGCWKTYLPQVVSLENFQAPA
jgi:hypothetical protein